MLERELGPPTGDTQRHFRTWMQHKETTDWIYVGSESQLVAKWRKTLETEYMAFFASAPTSPPSAQSYMESPAPSPNKHG
eukprot:6461421-Amphidinium_carterae.1